MAEGRSEGPTEAARQTRGELRAGPELRFVIRTPQKVVLDAPVRALRLPTPSGQAGLRPGEERLALVVESGLLVLTTSEGRRFAASAGGLLEGDRAEATLFTPFAVIGDSAEQVLAALDQAAAEPAGELSARRRLAELEQRIVRELEPKAPIGRVGDRHG
jgi:F0F1-type ATP synthase epsilon subunit